MAQITITIPDAAVPRILDAFDATYPGRPAGVTKGEWAQQKVKQYVTSVTVGYEADQAAKVARDAKISEVETAIP